MVEEEDGAEGHIHDYSTWREVHSVFYAQVSQQESLVALDRLEGTSDIGAENGEEMADSREVGVCVSDGELVVLVDSRQRKTMSRVKAGGSSHTHWGTIRHDDLIGIGYGQQVLSSKKKPYRVFKATLSEFIYAMPRGAQVIYPKDLAQILFNLDLFPGARVLESGVGSGALSTSLVRAGALVDGVEIREEFANIAMKNLRSLVSPDLWSKYQIRIGNAYEDDLGSGYDRAVLDLPEPWKALEGVRSAISQTGILCCFVTNITQLMELHEALPRSGFTLVTSSETMEREWYLNGRIARPQHRMTAHSGFITTARVAPLRNRGLVQPTPDEASAQSNLDEASAVEENGLMGDGLEEVF